MLVYNGDKEFSIIEIKPESINLKENEIVMDNVSEITNPLHNYITRKIINIEESCIAGNYTTVPLGIKDLNKYEQKIKESGLLEDDNLRIE